MRLKNMPYMTVKVLFHNMLWLLYVVFGASLKPKIYRAYT